MGGGNGSWQSSGDEISPLRATDGAESPPQWFRYMRSLLHCEKLPFTYPDFFSLLKICHLNLNTTSCLSFSSSSQAAGNKTIWTNGSVGMHGWQSWPVMKLFLSLDIYSVYLSKSTNSMLKCYFGQSQIKSNYTCSGVRTVFISSHSGALEEKGHQHMRG